MWGSEITAIRHRNRHVAALIGSAQYFRIVCFLRGSAQIVSARRRGVGEPY